MKAKYINPFTDFGFKKLFGEEGSKPLLLNFLNDLLPLDSPIHDLSFRNSEQLGLTPYERKAIFDIYCQDQQGNYFIVEMQKAKQNFFKDRTVFYSTFPIREQAERGEWDFALKAVFCVGLLDFVFDEDKDNPDYLHEVKLKNRHNKVFYDKYTLFFIEMPKFQKTEAQLGGHFDKWIYFLKHLEDFQNIPDILKEPVFELGFQRAALASLDENERMAYEESLKVYRDWINITATAIQEGIEKGVQQAEQKGIQKGRQEEKQAIARQMKAKGFDMDTIAELTGLSPDEIATLV